MKIYSVLSLTVGRRRFSKAEELEKGFPEAVQTLSIFSFFFFFLITFPSNLLIALLGAYWNKPRFQLQATFSSFHSRLQRNFIKP